MINIEDRYVNNDKNKIISIFQESMSKMIYLRVNCIQRDDWFMQITRVTPSLKYDALLTSPFQVLLLNTKSCRAKDYTPTVGLESLFYLLELLILKKSLNKDYISFILIYFTDYLLIIRIKMSS